ncbi:MAG: nickel pincer cofactor biosynthesis protein LarC [Candidatus Margulisbacteria bacterium]|nr:nickel pincer cofactor biosynthesis protein LarC [Candidatus Margulisiibacteriota bacterium]
MKIAYFDCSSGLAGNMILGAFLDAGLDKNYLINQLGNLRINFAVSRLQIKKTKKHHINGTYFEVISNEQHHRNLADILRLINRSKLPKTVKTLSAKIFRRLAKAEAKVHGTTVNKVHFHEVGAVDAIIDIVGTAIALEKLGIGAIYASPIPHGQGFIKHAHGILPNPAPATAELLKGIPTYGIEVTGEVVTPTGAAIISTLASGFGPAPKMAVEEIGSGAGSKPFPTLGMLRVYIGEANLPTENEAILEIETNIDDMGIKTLNKAIAALMKAGALDAFIEPILMKKERNANKLTLLCRPEKKDQLLALLFKLTTTLGVRMFLVSREVLKRKFVSVSTKYGKVKLKLGLLEGKVMTAAPEYENLRRLAKKHRVPISNINLIYPSPSGRGARGKGF